jgi:hypothetical protein
VFLRFGRIEHGAGTELALLPTAENRTGVSTSASSPFTTKNRQAQKQHERREQSITSTMARMPLSHCNKLSNQQVQQPKAVQDPTVIFETFLTFADWKWISRPERAFLAAVVSSLRTNGPVSRANFQRR